MCMYVVCVRGLHTKEDPGGETNGPASMLLGL